MTDNFFEFLLRLYEGKCEKIKKSKPMQFKYLTLGKLFLEETIFSKEFSGEENGLKHLVEKCFAMFPETRNIIEWHKKDPDAAKFCLYLLSEVKKEKEKIH